MSPPVPAVRYITTAFMMAITAPSMTATGAMITIFTIQAAAADPLFEMKVIISGMRRPRASTASITPIWDLTPAILMNLAIAEVCLLRIFTQARLTKNQIKSNGESLWRILR
jgi:hypothetical protein